MKQKMNLCVNTGDVLVMFIKSKIHEIDVMATKITIRNNLHWLPVMHCSVFKMALLVFKFLHSGYPKYFEPFLKPRHSVYRTRRSQYDGVLL